MKIERVNRVDGYSYNAIDLSTVDYCLFDENAKANALNATLRIEY